jgi:hypothetical protein
MDALLERYERQATLLVRDPWDDIAELKERQERDWKRRFGRILFEGDPYAADGIFYRDSRPPWIVAAETAITLAATDKLLYPGSRTALPANYFWAGKAVMLTVFGAMTTAATPGNLGIELYYGTTDAGGTLLASSAAVALTAARTSMACVIQTVCRCRTAGPTGTLLAYGQAQMGGASTNDLLVEPNLMIPASAPAAVTVDTTVASGFNVQIKRSGSTVETFTTHDIIFEALN